MSDPPCKSFTRLLLLSLCCACLPLLAGTPGSDQADASATGEPRLMAPATQAADDPVKTLAGIRASLAADSAEADPATGF